MIVVDVHRFRSRGRSSTNGALSALKIQKPLSPPTFDDSALDHFMDGTVGPLAQQQAKRLSTLSSC
ncbi:hypothetical protein ACRAWF_03170 [Streptomyces sp. L7]